MVSGFGFVVGRVLESGHGGTPRPARGRVVFTSAEDQLVPGEDALLTSNRVECWLDGEGYLVGQGGVRGVWLSERQWTVVLHVGRPVPPLSIRVTSAHTEDAPLDLSDVLGVPPSPPESPALLPPAPAPGMLLTSSPDGPQWSPAPAASAPVVAADVAEWVRADAGLREEIARVLPPAAGSVSPAEIARVVGGVLHVGEQPPAAAEMHGVPVVWMRTGASELVRVTATPPAFDVVRRRVTLPQLVGVVYTINGRPRTGTYGVPGSDEQLVTVIAEAEAGYELVGDRQWSATMGAPLAPGTLLGEETFDGSAGWVIPEDAEMQGSRRLGPQLASAGARGLSWVGWGSAPSLVRDGQGAGGVLPGTGSVTAMLVDPGVSDVQVEIDVQALPAEGEKATLAVRFGADPHDPSPFQTGGFQPEIRWTPGRDVAVQPDAKLWFTQRAGTEGTWTFTRTGRTITVRSPHGNTGAWNREDQPGDWGTGIVFSLPTGASPAFRISSIRIKAA